MALSEAKKRSNKKWNDANKKNKYDTVTMLIPKGRRQTIKAHAKAHGETISVYLSRLCRADMGLTEDEWKKPEQGEEL